MKKFAVLILSVMLALSVCACGGAGGGGADGNKIKLLVDLHGWTPTINTTATASTPEVFNSPRYIAAAFEKLYPEVKIEWVRNKNINSSDAQGEMSSYFVNAIARGNCPVIAFTWGTTFQDRDYYVDLTEYLNQPNPFEEKAESPCVMAGYYNDTEKTNAKIKNGWLYTGDAAHVDCDGYLYIDGRKDNMLIRSGLNVYPEEIETVASACAGVQNCIAYGEDDKLEGVKIVLAYTGDATEQFLRKYLSSRLSPHLIPRVIKEVNAIPATPSGKTARIC